MSCQPQRDTCNRSPVELPPCRVCLQPAASAMVSAAEYGRFLGRPPKRPMLEKGQKSAYRTFSVR